MRCGETSPSLQNSCVFTAILLTGDVLALRDVMNDVLREASRVLRGKPSPASSLTIGRARIMAVVLASFVTE